MSEINEQFEILRAARNVERAHARLQAVIARHGGVESALAKVDASVRDRLAALADSNPARE